MKWIDYKSPSTVRETTDLLSKHDGRVSLLAGGTDLLVQLRGGQVKSDLILDIKNVPELNEISHDANNGLTLGASVECYKIYSDDNIRKGYPGLIDAATLIGGTQIQGRASIGGNLCNAAPSGDSIPILIALEATCNITGPNGTRNVPVESFCTAPRRNVLQPGELLESLHFPSPTQNSGAHYMRFIPRNEMDIAVAGVGVSVILEGNTFKNARIALASVAPTPLFVKEAGEALIGKPVNDDSIQAAANIAREAAKPISDMRGTIEHRKQLCEVLTKRALKIAIERTKEAH